MENKKTINNDFKKSFGGVVQSSLKKTRLYSDRIADDIKSGEVFPAFRNGSIDFYYRGGKLFEFRDKFKTHVKYASVLHGCESAYISDEELQGGVRLIGNFMEGYARIKENCALYSGVESSGIAEIYKRSGYVNSKEDVVVLDIEVSLRSIDNGWVRDIQGEKEKRKMDRIDLLLYSKKTRRLQFYEVKHFSNKEIWSTQNTKPQVVKQIQRYNEQLSVRHSQILEEYKKYISIARQIFDISEEDLPDPVSLEKEVVLFVFGFDNNQKKKIAELLVDDYSLAGLKYRFYGDPKSATQLWTNIKKGM